MTSSVPRLPDWQENLLGTDEAGRYLHEQIDAVPDVDSALRLLKAFMLVSVAQLDEIPRIMGEGPSGEQETVSSICHLLRDECRAQDGAVPRLSEDDVSMAAQMTPAHFMAVYERNPLLAEHDFVTFNILETLAGVHGRVAAQLSSDFSGLAKSRAKAHMLSCQTGTAESAAAKRMFSMYYGIFLKDQDLDDVCRCVKTCRRLAEVHDCQCGHEELVGQAVDEAFSAYEKDCASGRKPAYPNPFGLKLTPELKVENRGIMGTLCDVFNSSRLGAERRERMKSAVLRISGLAEMVDFFRTVASRYVKFDLDGFGKICEMDEASRRFAKIAKEDSGVARMVRERYARHEPGSCRRSLARKKQIDDLILPDFPLD